MKVLLFITSLLTATSSFAYPCFNSGSYRGMGIAKDAAGKTSVYEVETEFKDSAQGVSRYQWAKGGKAEFSFAASAKGILLINGKDTGATVKCDVATQSIHMPLDGGLVLDESWLFAGNYLLRRGQKGTAKGPIVYQELLIRQN